MTSIPQVHDLAKMIDHSLLHPTMTDNQLIEGCHIAREYDVASVCIKPYAVKLARDLLRDSEVAVGTVVGFPHGSSATSVKVYETENACHEGASEIDMVDNLGRVLQTDWGYVQEDIRAVLDVCRANNAILKVIFENDFLPDARLKIRLCEICSFLKVDFAKTSTGYGFVKGSDGKYSYQGATHEDLILMRKYCSDDVRIKAAGGVRTLEDLLEVRELGVTRVGATATIAILDAARIRLT